MKTLLTCSAAVLTAVLVACDDRTGSNATSTRPVTGGANNANNTDGYNNTGEVGASNTRDADNTARNRGDEPGDGTTAEGQSNTQADIDITAEIRRQIMDADNMSMNAQNVKIVTDAGVVTLRGPVETADEKSRIEAIAAAVAGVSRVENLLEVKTAN
jgi:hypothetical protein